MPIRSHRLKTVHSYHDANIQTVEVIDSSVVLSVQLCGCSDAPAALVHLTFHGVRNVAEVRDAINQARRAFSSREPEIIGLLRDQDRRFVLDLDAGTIYIDAKSFTET